MVIELYLQAICTGILLSGIYAIVAIGLTFVFGTLKIINFAHGEFLMAGMYLVFLFCSVTGLSAYASIPIVVILLFVLGIATFYFLIKPVLGKPDLNQILLTMGIAWVLQNLALLIFSSNVYKVNSKIGLKSFFLYGIAIEHTRLIAFLVSLLCGFCVFFLLHKTNMGRIIRASADNREAAVRMGINVGKVYMFSFGFGIAILGIAAGLLVPFYQITPHVGFSFTIMAFVIAILGHLGSLKGAVVGAIIVAVSESLGALIFPGTLGAISPYVLFVLILLFMPDGIFPKEGL